MFKVPLEEVEHVAVAEGVDEGGGGVVVEELVAVFEAAVEGVFLLDGGVRVECEVVAGIFFEIDLRVGSFFLHAMIYKYCSFKCEVGKN